MHPSIIRCWPDKIHVFTTKIYRDQILVGSSTSKIVNKNFRFRYCFYHSLILFAEKVHGQSDNTQQHESISSLPGFFLAGIMAVYAISGVVMIFRDTDFLKREMQIEKKLAPGLKVDELGQAIRIRNLKAESETNELIRFPQGYYNKVTGMTVYVTKSLPKV
jgi:hypothetical protein